MRHYLLTCDRCRVTVPERGRYDPYLLKDGAGQWVDLCDSCLERLVRWRDSGPASTP